MKGCMREKQLVTYSEIESGWRLASVRAKLLGSLSDLLKAMYSVKRTDSPSDSLKGKLMGMS